MAELYLGAITSNGRSIAGKRHINDGAIACQLLTQGDPYQGLVSEIGDRLESYEVTSVSERAYKVATAFPEGWNSFGWRELWPFVVEWRSN